MPQKELPAVALLSQEKSAFLSQRIYITIWAKKTKNPNIAIRVSWYLQGSNQGHMDFQSIALPSELRYHSLSRLQI